MKTGCEKRLDKSFQNAPVIALYPCSKVVLFSDCHRGVGNANDNFLKNQNLYFAALRHYYKDGFLYIELGDGDELWENRSLSVIKEIHSNVFWLLSLFQEENRLYLLYGNHDHCLKSSRDIPHYAGLILKLCGYTCSTPTSNKKDPGKKRFCTELYLTHGHQADFLNSTLWKLSRFLVRYLWKPLEHIGVLDPTSAAKNYRRRLKSERRLAQWAVNNNCCLITGHTHRPMLDESKPQYFNTGSCVHPRCITCLEIERGAISLVKWHTDTRPDNSLYVARTVLAGPIPLWEP